jgi:hypothetical protein
MPLVLPDRVKVTSSTTGTGTLTLGSALTGFETFESVGDGNTTYYVIQHTKEDEWEVGLGTYTSSGTTLSRDTIFQSSNSDSAVDFSSGSKIVFVTIPAAKVVYKDASGTVNIGALDSASVSVTGNISVTGTVDGRDIATDGTKLDGIESGATADQTGAEIKSLYESESDTNAFTDAEKTKLTGIETGATADQTGAEIKSLYESEADTNAFTDAEKTKLTGIETGATADQTGAEIKSLYESEADTNAFTDAEKTKLTGIETGATADQTGTEIATAISGETVASLTITSADINGGTIDGVNIGASTAGTGLFTTLETSGGAIIGGDLTVNGTTTTINSTTLTVDDLNIVLASGAANAAAANGAGITVDGASATFTYGSTADAWQFNKGLDVTGAIIVSGTVDGRDLATDGSKLDGIEAGATADQTGSEIATAISGETVAVLSISDATISSGSISGITDLAVADGGTGASTAADARANLDVDQAGTAVALAIALG